MFLQNWAEPTRLRCSIPARWTQADVRAAMAQRRRTSSKRAVLTPHANPLSLLPACLLEDKPLWSYRLYEQIQSALWEQRISQDDITYQMCCFCSQIHVLSSLKSLKVFFLSTMQPLHMCIHSFKKKSSFFFFFKATQSGFLYILKNILSQSRLSQTRCCDLQCQKQKRESGFEMRFSALWRALNTVD